MTAVPMILEEALRYEGFTIDVTPAAAFDIVLPSGTMHVPAMLRSSLTWAREEPVTPEQGADLYLRSFPIFHESYRPVLLSHILDRYRTRRIGYNTPGEWMLAFRRWGNLNMTVPNRRYVSTAVDLPLDDVDLTDTTAATRHSLDVASDFPQSLISDSTDYATSADDRRAADNTTLTRVGRSTSIMELLEAQRTAYLNVDAEVLDGMDSLFLSVLDQGEGNRYTSATGLAPYGGLPRMDWDWPYGYDGRDW